MEIQEANNKLLELIERIALEHDYNNKIKVLIDYSFYPEGCVTIKFKKPDIWNEDLNEINFITILKQNNEYINLINIIKKPPLVDFTGVNND